MKKIINISHSVKQRLLNISKEKEVGFQSILRRYAFERLLFRIEHMPGMKDYILKGAMLLYVWGGDDFRPTMDLDLLGVGPNQPEKIRTLFKELCVLDNKHEDGLIFNPESVKVTSIQDEETYVAVRVTLLATLGKARIDLQVDVGAGDAVLPEPEFIDFPALLDMPVPRILAYNPENVIAEKLEAIVNLGFKNSRIKDYYDIWALPKICRFDLDRLSTAIAATFSRRKTSIPELWPEGLEQKYFISDHQIDLWNAFIKRGKLKYRPDSFKKLGAEVRDFLELPIQRVTRQGKTLKIWSGAKWKNG